MMCEPIESFMLESGIHPGAIDLENETQRLLSEMRLSLGSASGALHMYPSRIALPEGPPPEGRAIALDAGGTHFRVAVVAFRGGAASIEYRASYPMPGTDGTITKSEFLRRCALYVEPVLGMSDKVGYVFSYPAEILPDRDGRLRLFQKEVSVPGSEGMVVCAELESELKRRGAAGERSYVLLNDTVASLVGAYVSSSGREYDGALGLVYGTGTNTCYYDRCAGQIINMESSSYTLFPKSVFDLRLDAGSAEPGDNLYEKMAASAYTGGLTTLCAEAAAEKGLFSGSFAEAIKKNGPLTAMDADVFMRTGQGIFSDLCRTPEDSFRLRRVTELIYDRAAALGCVVLTAAMEMSGAGIRGPACIAAEGAGFWDSVLYAPKLRRAMDEFAGSKKRRKFEFVRTEDANLIGAAAAAL